MLRGGVPELLGLLDLETVERNLYLGRSPENRSGRVYGGQVAAQALVAAHRTLADARGAWPAHSCHGYFLRAGDPRRAILFEVEPIRDGGSFATRRVLAVQAGRAIFNLDVSFHRAEPGLEHHLPAPRVTAPDSLPTEAERLELARRSHPERVEGWTVERRPFDFRWAEPRRIELEDRNRPPRQRCWMRLDGELPPRDDHPALHAALLLYASDHSILDTAIYPHAGTFDHQAHQIASLDHALWLHRPLRVDEWLLYDQDSPSSHAARGFSRGTIYDADGRLVASAIQESLMRPTGRAS